MEWQSRNYLYYDDVILLKWHNSKGYGFGFSRHDYEVSDLVFQNKFPAFAFSSITQAVYLEQFIPADMRANLHYIIMSMLGTFMA